MIIKCRETLLVKVLEKKMLFFSHQDQKKKFFKIKDGLAPEKTPIVYPNQYPKHPLNDNAPIISRDRPTRYLTPKFEIPKTLLMEGDDFAK